MINKKILTIGTLLFSFGIHAFASDAEWKPAENRLWTKWGKEVSPDKVFPEYPRPQMVREGWVNLNGLWDFTVLGQDAGMPTDFSRKILVPFPIESALSGVREGITDDQKLWYKRSISLEKPASGKRILLHFEAVDWESEVWVNGQKAGVHKGGYDPFFFDITEYLNNQGRQEIIVGVRDAMRDGHPVGKQALEPDDEPKGIRYVQSSGIWQPVWLETVPETHIERYKIVPDIDKEQLEVTVFAVGPKTGSSEIRITAKDGSKAIASVSAKSGETVYIPVKQPKLWSPGSPFLYDLEISLNADGSMDNVKGYFGMRKISLGKDEKGITRIMLNNAFVFQAGVLDQGYWPDGLHTPPSDAAYVFDIQVMKDYGFNLLRKHIKVESSRWYYWCDKLGMLVWQDMPSGGPKDTKTKDQKDNFDNELKNMIEKFYNHPSIVMWIPFNESWGQNDTERVVEYVYTLDKSRLVNNASGWDDHKVGDIYDIHAYPGPGFAAPEEKRAAVVGEFGGLGYDVPQHAWVAKGWGYEQYANLDILQRTYENLWKQVYDRVKNPGLSGAVYTQLCDVEGENNGLLSYDRKFYKLPLSVAPFHKGQLAPRQIERGNLFVGEGKLALETAVPNSAIYYTTDGNTPTEKGMRYTGPISLEADTIVKAIAVYPDGYVSGVETFYMKQTELLPGMKTEGLEPGLKASVYKIKREGDNVPDFSKITPEKTLVTNNVSLAITSHKLDFAVKYEGYIHIPKDGVYNFFLYADDGARLLIDGKPLIPRVHYTDTSEPEPASIALEAGYHAIEVGFFQYWGEQFVRLQYQAPGSNAGPVPDGMLFHAVSQ